MAGKKKSKKPAANPARGFATTSIASSKPRPDPTEAADDVAGQNAPQSKDSPPSAATGQKTTAAAATSAPVAQAPALSPEEYERQLDESELQLLVEKYAQKVRRDAQRQNTRLETDRRLLRGQAESIGAKKWLPQELMDHVLDLIQAEGRFAASSVSSDGATSRLPAEEDLIVKLWTLQLTLTASDCPPDRIQPALQYVLDIAPNISPTAKSDSVWGLDEVLDWLARECDKNELPDYTGRSKTLPKSQAGKIRPQDALVAVMANKTGKDTPQDSPAGSGRTTPFLDLDSKSGSKLKNGAANSRSPKAPSPRHPAVKFDEDIEPDQLLPFFLETKEKLFAIQRPRQDVPKGRGKADVSQRSPEEALLLAKIDRVEKDVLFDKYIGEQEWRKKRIVLEREYAAGKRQRAVEEEQKKARDSASDSSDDEDEDDVAKEAERIAAEILAENSDSDDQALAGLFASLPVNEVDPITGKSSTVMNNADGSKITIRDFGKWAGVTPMRALEEACRSRFGSPWLLPRYKLTTCAETLPCESHTISSPMLPLRVGMPSRSSGPKPKRSRPPSRQPKSRSLPCRTSSSSR